VREIPQLRTLRKELFEWQKKWKWWTVMKRLGMYHMLLPKLPVSILLLRHLIWPSMWMNGPQKAVRIFLVKLLRLWKCSLRLVQPVLLMVLCKLVRWVQLILLRRVCFLWYLLCIKWQVNCFRACCMLVRVPLLLMPCRFLATIPMLWLAAKLGLLCLLRLMLSRLWILALLLICPLFRAVSHFCISSMGSVHRMKCRKLKCWIMMT